jgi:hypothetical protein
VNWLLLRNNFVTLHVCPARIRAINPFKLKKLVQVGGYRRFGTTYRFHIQGPGSLRGMNFTLEDGTWCRCPATNLRLETAQKGEDLSRICYEFCSETNALMVLECWLFVSFFLQCPLLILLHVLMWDMFQVYNRFLNSFSSFHSLFSCNTHWS